MRLGAGCSQEPPEFPPAQGAHLERIAECP